MQEKSSISNRTIRDFIYVDVDRLNSLYSQIFEGIAEAIVDSVITQDTTKTEKRGGMLSGESIEQKLAEASFRTESKVLYDHMYNVLERRLEASIFEPAPFTVSLSTNGGNVEVSEGLDVPDLDIVGDKQLIKVTGRPVVQDYSSLQRIVEKWPEFTDAIAMAELDNQELMGEIYLLEKRLGWESAKETKTQIKRRLEKARSEFQNALISEKTKLNLIQPPDFMNAIMMVINLFYKGIFEIMIMRDEDQAPLTFRGIIESKWLRYAPMILRSLYGSSLVEGSWTMVGLVTHNPFNASDRNAVNTRKIQVQENLARMKDRLRELFYSMVEVEKTFLLSGDALEYHVSPIAIYREIEIGSTQM